MGGVEIVVLRSGERFRQSGEVEHLRLIVFSGSLFISIDLDSDIGAPFITAASQL